MKRTIAVLSEQSRARIRQCSSGLTGEEWADIPMDEKKEYVRNLELVVEDIMMTEPEAFTRRAVAHAKETRERRMARSANAINKHIEKVAV